MTSIPVLAITVGGSDDLLFDNLRWHFGLGFRHFTVAGVPTITSDEALYRFQKLTGVAETITKLVDRIDFAVPSDNRLIFSVQSDEFLHFGTSSLAIVGQRFDKAFGEDKVACRRITIPVFNFVKSNEDDPTELRATRRMVFRHKRPSGWVTAFWWSLSLQQGSDVPPFDGSSYNYRISSYAERNISVEEDISALVFDPLPDDLDGSATNVPARYPARFSRLHIANGTKLDKIVARRCALRAYSVSVYIPGLRHPVDIRVGSSDEPTFYQVFTRLDYDFNLPRDPETIVDLGANAGYASLYFHSRYPKARLIAVEPNPDNFFALKRNCLDIPEITPVWAAIWKCSGFLSLVEQDDRNRPLGFWGTQTKPAENGAQGDIPALSMPDLMRRFDIDHVDLLKVDIEGAELDLFETGAEQWVSRVHTVAIETHDRFRPGSEDAVRRVFSNADFVESKKGENLIFQRPLQ